MVIHLTRVGKIARMKTRAGLANARLCYRRYMPSMLRNLALIITLVSPVSVLACVVPNIIEDGSVTITPDEDADSGMYHVRIPGEYKGAPLEFLILTASSGDNEVSVPLSIKSKDGMFGSHFYLSSSWVNIRVSASYEGMLCTDLVAKLSM